MPCQVRGMNLRVFWRGGTHGPQGFPVILAHTFMKSLSVLMLAATLSLQPFASGARIEWDPASVQRVQPGAYGRVRVLKDGRWALVSSEQRRVEIAFSKDRGVTWTPPAGVAEMEGYYLTNSEMVELDDGRLLYGFNARPLIKEGGTLPYAILTVESSDGGLTWTKPHRVFQAGTGFGDGCWEPSFLQLPSGELQMYFANEGPYVRSDEQEISYLSSWDGGRSWGAVRTLSFRKGSRDGMPVPLLLEGRGEIVVAIEDNGLSGDFKPVLLHSKPGASWGEEILGGDSRRRVPALQGAFTPASRLYMGAPYLVQLGSGATVLSVQSSAGRLKDSADYSVAEVFVGDRKAGNFGEGTRPFPGLPPQATANWNGLTAIGEREVLIVSSIHDTKSSAGSAIWIARGTLIDDEPSR